MRSLSEIETTSKRASKASGFSWGVSEEVGKAIRLLELFGFPGIKNINQYFIERKKKKFEQINLIKKDNDQKNLLFCPIIFGVNFMDQIKIIEKFEKINISGLAFPLLVIPFLSKSSEIIGKKIHCKIDDDEFLLNLNVNISSNILKDKDLKTSSNLQITFIENIDSFSNEVWKNLYKFSEETFVEETDSLKKEAAGAGLNDND